MVLGLLLNACNNDEAIPPHDLAGDWKVISFDNNETSTSITKTEENTWLFANNGDITVNFSNSDLTNGEMSGRTVTNNFSGDYTIDLKGGISIDPPFSTEAGEPEWGLLFDSVTEAETYELRSDQLIIYYNEKRNSITFDRVNK